MNELLDISASLTSKTSASFYRYLHSQIDWNNRLIGIKGARGTGKTTLVLQWLKSQGISTTEAAYFSLDELYFSQNHLQDVAKQFYQKGGKVLVLDEVHKYPGWSSAIKNLYDRYEDLKIIFTGSSIIDISKQEADLSRRVLMYELKGLSFREYLELAHSIKLPRADITELVSPNQDYFRQLPAGFKPYAYFDNYLRFGYYPFFTEDRYGYHTRLNQLIRTIVEYDMAEVRGFDIRHAKKLLQLLFVIAQQVPFKPNIQSLANKSGIHRNSINSYLYFLHEARLINLLLPAGISVAGLQKPEKVFLDNTSLLYALAENPSIGTVREVFFNNQVSVSGILRHSPDADFRLNDKYYFEIGGKNKEARQITGLPNAWLVKDDITFPSGRAIPLWMFGMLY